METMKCKVMPLKKYTEISYRVKCVAVESERLFGDVYVAEQTRNIVYCADGYHFPPVYKRSKFNQMHQVLDTPDFMQLNSRPSSRKGSVNAIPPAIPMKRRAKSLDHQINITRAGPHSVQEKKPKVYPAPLPQPAPKQEMVSSLVDQLLLDIYGLSGGDRCRSESDSTASSLRPRPQHRYLQRARLQLKSKDELQVLVVNLREHISHAGGLLVRYLRKRDYLLAKRDKQCDVITAHLQAHSPKRIEDTKMRFSLTPQPGESGFQQWLDAMKMVARLQGGIPPEFRKRLWLILAERHLEQRGIDWKQAEKICFNEWSNPDDEELGIQIVKDLHRTGCSLFCGAAGRDNQAVLRRVLLGFARWNKSVGYCQGLNVLAALVLQVMDRAESSAVKVMIYLIEGVLPEGYFADNLRGLSIDMAVFRDLLRSRLPKLSKHLEALQTDAKDKATGSSYEPPLTNVFTMQWFLTLFCHCLPQDTVLRVWDLIFLEGDEILLRTALAIWEGLSDRIMTVTSADEFYSIMGVLTREMLEFTDTNNLIKNIVGMGPLHNVTGLREKHRYNITPWARKLSDDEDSDTEEDERLAVAAAMVSMAQRLKKDCVPSTMGALQSMASSHDRERLALDISTLKQQYAKLRERQRQAHIILSAACARQSMVPQPTSQAMNHLLVGKNALVSGKSRPLSLPSTVVPAKTRPVAIHSPRTQNRRDKQGVTLHWKDTKKTKDKPAETNDPGECGSVVVQLPQESAVNLPSPKRSSIDSDSDSTSTELCDESDRLSDLDSEEATSTSECYVMATDQEKSPRVEKLQTEPSDAVKEGLGANVEQPSKKSEVKQEEEGVEETPCLSDTSVAKITDQIRRLSAENDNNLTELEKQPPFGDETASGINFSISESPVHYEDSTVDHVTDSDPLKTSLRKSDSINYLDFAHRDDVIFRQSETTSSSNETTDTFYRKLSDAEESEKITSVDKDLGDIAQGVTNIEENLVTDDYRLAESENKSNDNSSNSQVVEDSEKVISSSTESRENQTYSMYESFKMQEKDSEYNDDGNLSDPVTDKSVKLQEDVPAFAKYESKTLNVFQSEREEQQKNSMFDATAGVHDSKESARKVDPQETFSETANITNKPAGDGLNLYSTSYVVGHFPISPVSVDQKLQQKLHLSSPLNSPTIIPQRVNMDLDISTKSESQLSNKPYIERRSYFDTKKSPRTPDSGTSFSSGETMGPDSKPSSLTMSPKTPIKSDSRDFTIDKSVSSSVSSDSKTLTLRSLDSDPTKDTLKVDGKRSSYEKSSPSTPISTDSLKNKSDVSPKFVVSSSSDSCSPSKLKSSERSFSSDLQSPISANSIKYTSNYNKSSRNSPIDPCAATSPFYPIAHPNQNTPSAYSVNKRSNVENVDLLAEQKSANAKGTAKYLNYQSKVGTSLSEITDRDIDSISRGSDIYVRPQFTVKKPNTATDLPSREKDFTEASDIRVGETYRDTRKFTDDDAEELSEKDELAQLPQEKLDKHYYNYRHKKSTKVPFERSCSSLERTFASLKSSMSTDELKTSTAKKRSSDILQDMKHLEAKANDETSSSGMMTKKSSYIWEDMKNLEARRQDTFTDSASTFSKRRLDVPDINISAERRNSYVVHPKINIDEGSDSILKTLTRDKNKDNGDSDDGRESKLGVWTKVKPRKKGNNGRRSSDRALKIIQENSVILHKILACQAKKRLPDLEEISKEITISPINEEISKIFSPILEKMGLNEHEINEELARINFKDFDDVAATNVSEFDAKINDELSKLSLIDDTEEIDPLDIDDIASHDYLDTREALIDRKINEELSKLLANYEGESPASIVTLDKGSSQNNSDPEGLDLTSISTNVFSYKSSNDSIETRSDVGSMHESAIQPEKFSQYKESALSYPSSAQYTRDLSPKSDIDIYRELEKLDKISSAQVLPETSPCIPPKGLSPIQYIPSTSPYTIASPTARYSTKPTSYDASPIKPSYESYKPYEYTSKLSPAKTTGNFYTTASYDPSDTFAFRDQKPGISENDYDLHKSILSKENLEFRVRYDDEPVHGDHQYLNVQQESLILNKGIPYYGTERNKPVTPTKYVPKNERCFDSPATALVEYSSELTETFRRKYDPLSPQDYAHEKSLDYNKHLVGLGSVEQKTSASGSYSPMRHRDVSPLSPNRQFAEGQFASSFGHYVSKLSPGFAEEAIRPISHPEFPGKAIASRRPDLPNRDSVSYKKSSMSLGNIGYTSTTLGKKSQDTSPSPKTQFSPFPVRNIARKPKELTLKLGLYSQKPSEIGQSKKS